MRKLLHGIAYALLLIVAAFDWVVILIWMLVEEGLKESEKRNWRQRVPRLTA